MAATLFSSTFDAWRRSVPSALGGGPGPALAPGVRIIDPWPGDAGAGRAILSGFLSIGGAQHAMEGGFGQGPQGAAWEARLHGFAFLRDLRALGGTDGRRAARTMIASWIASHPRPRAGTIAARPDVAGARIAAWLSHHDTLIADADDMLRSNFAASLHAQARALHKDLTSGRAGPPGLGALRAAVGLLLASIAFPDSPRWNEAAITALGDALAQQILPDGGHVSRSPALLAAALAAALEARCALTTNARAVPAFLDEAVARMGPALRFFRYTDKGLAMFHGAQEGCPAFLDALCAQAGSGGGRVPGSLPLTGYERLAQGRSVVLMDVGAPPPAPFDDRAHGAPLAFEFCYGRERVLTSCGGHPLPGDWREALRATPAHCALTLGDRSACEIGPGGGLSRRASRTAPVREDAGGAASAEACHDGYVPVCGVVHRRRLHLAERGQDLRGLETLTATTGAPGAPVPAAVRFHLHPRVSVALVRGGAQALARVPGGAGWRFACEGGVLALENSVYMGQGAQPRKTKQIVIRTALAAKSAQIRWGLRREK